MIKVTSLDSNQILTKMSVMFLELKSFSLILGIPILEFFLLKITAVLLIISSSTLALKSVLI